MRYLITITAEDGRVVLTEEVPFSLAANTATVQEYAEQNDGHQLSEGEQVLLHAAPQLCPWDCDHCRS